MKKYHWQCTVKSNQETVMNIEETKIKWLKIIDILFVTITINAINVLAEPVTFVSEILKY